MPEPAPRRAFRKMDAYAQFDLRRRYNLKPADMTVLNALTLVADFRSRICTTSLIEFAQEYTGQDTRTVATAIERLSACGLITVVAPFGPRARGAIRVECYYELVVPEKRTLPTEDISGGNSAQTRKPPRFTRENEGLGGSEAGREGVVVLCSTCDEKADGIPNEDGSPSCKVCERF